MGSSDGSQFLREYPGGMRCLRASASVAFAAGLAAGLATGVGFLAEEEGREECVFFGVEVDVDSRRLRVEEVDAGGACCSYCS